MTKTSSSFAINCIPVFSTSVFIWLNRFHRENHMITFSHYRPFDWSNDTCKSVTHDNKYLSFCWQNTSEDIRNQ